MVRHQNDQIKQGKAFMVGLTTDTKGFLMFSKMPTKDGFDDPYPKFKDEPATQL